MNNLTKLYVWLLTFTAHLRNKKGQTLVEYALILALIAILLLTALTFLKDKTCNVYSAVGSALSN